MEWFLFFSSLYRLKDNLNLFMLSKNFIDKKFVYPNPLIKEATIKKSIISYESSLLC